MRQVAPLIARLFLAALFILSGVQKFMSPGESVQYMNNYGLPASTILLYLAALVEVGGGLSILLGWRAQWGATLLLLYLIPVTLIFHTNFGDQNQQVQFMKNLAIMGGLIMMAFYGAGAWSLDAKRHGQQTSWAHG